MRDNFAESSRSSKTFPLCVTPNLLSYKGNAIPVSSTVIFRASLCDTLQLYTFLTDEFHKCAQILCAGYATYDLHSANMILFSPKNCNCNYSVLVGESDYLEVVFREVFFLN